MSKPLKIKGILHKIGDVQYVTDSFKMRYFVLEIPTNNTYTNYMIFQLVQSKIDLLDKYKIGDDFTVFYNINGNISKNLRGRIDWDYHNNLIAYQVGNDDYQKKAIKKSIKGKEDNSKMDTDFEKSMQRDND